MLATAKRATIVALWLVCCYYVQAATNRHNHVRTKSSTREQKIQHLTTDMPLTTMVASAATISSGKSTETDTEADNKSSNVNTGSGSVGGLRNFLFRKPNNIFNSLMQNSIKVVQRGMNAFQGVSNKVYHVARKQIVGPHIGGSSSASVGKSGEGSDSIRKPAKRHAVAVKKPTGFVKRVAKMLDTGIAGIEEVTDLGLMLGNIGTHKLMAKLNGKSGNEEIFKILIKYVGSKVGKGAKGNVNQFVDDVGTVSTFAATDDEVTNSISTLMEKLMSNPKVSAAMVRLALTVLDGSPSTSCLLDQLPLSPQDVRMVFDVFVGSNGQIMLKTIAGLVSDLTTGPDTKAFLESALGMMSMFKSDTPGPPGADNSEKPTSIVNSLTSFFMGGDAEEEDDISEQSMPSPIVNHRKKSSSADFSGNVSKQSVKKPPKRKFDDDDWFSKNENTFESLTKKAKTKKEPRFSDIETTSILLQEKPANSKSDDLFDESSPANNVNSNLHRSDKKNEGRKKVKSESSDSKNFSDDPKSKSRITKNTKVVAEKQNMDDDKDEFSIFEDDLF